MLHHLQLSIHRGLAKVNRYRELRRNVLGRCRLKTHLNRIMKENQSFFSLIFCSRLGKKSHQKFIDSHTLTNNLNRSTSIMILISDLISHTDCLHFLQTLSIFTNINVDITSCIENETISFIH
jgi:hypothetical protein